MSGWFRRRPQWGLVAVLSAVATGLGALVSSVVALLLAAYGVGHASGQAEDTASLIAEVSIFVSAWVWLAVVGGGLGSLVARAVPEIWRQRRLHLAVTEVLRGRLGPRQNEVPVIVVDADWPMAMGVPGRRAMVVVSSGLAGHLTPVQLSAVVAHERAHLRWRHAAISRLGGLLAASLPGSGRARRFEAWVGELLEYAADDAASGEVGAAPLAEALRTLSVLRDDAALATRAERLVALAA